MGLTQAEACDLFRREPERRLPVEAGEVAYRRVGSGPDVLFVHGWPVSSATFRRLLPHLAPHVTCHLVDFPGAGDGRAAPGVPLTPEQHVSTLREVIDAIGLTRFAAVGHDSGGLIARHALAGDGRLSGLGLLNTEQPQGLSLPFRAFLAGRYLPGLGAALGSLTRLPRALRRAVLSQGPAFVVDPTLEKEFAEFFLEPLRSDRARRAAAVELLRTFDVRLVHELGGVHARITVPVALVWGERDIFLPVRWAADMARTFPRAELTVIPGAKLFVHEERPSEVAQALLPVLTGNVRPASPPVAAG